MKNLKEFLDNNIAIESFYNYLNVEMNQEIMISFMNLKKIQESSPFLSKIDFLKEYTNFKEKFKNDFNFESTTSERLFKEENDCEEILETLKLVESSILQNMTDPYERYQRNVTFCQEYKIKLEERNKNSKISNIIKEEEWIFNVFSKFPIIFQPRSQILVSQILYLDFLEFLLTKKNVYFDREKFSEITEKTLELQTCNLDFLLDEELLCFYMNIFNTLLIHSSLLLGEGSPNNGKEFQSYLGLCCYNIGGNVYSLRTLKLKIENLFKSVCFQQAPIVSLLSTIVIFSYTKEFEPFFVQDIVSCILKKSQNFVKNNTKIIKNQVLIPWIMREFMIVTNNVDKRYKERVCKLFIKETPRNGNIEIKSKRRLSFVEIVTGMMKNDKNDKKKEETININSNSVDHSLFIIKENDRLLDLKNEDLQTKRRRSFQDPNQRQKLKEKIGGFLNKKNQKFKELTITKNEENSTENSTENSINQDFFILETEKSESKKSTSLYYNYTLSEEMEETVLNVETKEEINENELNESCNQIEFVQNEINEIKKDDLLLNTNESVQNSNEVSILETKIKLKEKSNSLKELSSNQDVKNSFKEISDQSPLNSKEIKNPKAIIFNLIKDILSDEETYLWNNSTSFNFDDYNFNISGKSINKNNSF
jgi:hypothetical protein